MSGFRFDLLRAARDLPMPPPPPRLSATDKMVLVALVMRVNAEGTCWPSYARIASDTWLSKRAVIDSIARLREAGIIEVRQQRIGESREADTNVYRVRIEVVQQPHHVVQEVHHVGNEAHQGSAPAAPHVVRHVHQGGAPAAPEVLREVPKGSTNGSTQGFALSGDPERPKSSKGRKPPKHSPDVIAAKERIVAFFVDTVKAKKGLEKLELTHAGDHAAAFGLVKKYGETEALSILGRALEDPFVLGNCCTLRHIDSKADTWRGTAPAPRPNGRRQMVQQGEAFDIPKEALR